MVVVSLVVVVLQIRMRVPPILKKLGLPIASRHVGAPGCTVPGHRHELQSPPHVLLRGPLLDFPLGRRVSSPLLRSHGAFCAGVARCRLSSAPEIVLQPRALVRLARLCVSVSRRVLSVVVCMCEQASSTIARI